MRVGGTPLLKSKASPRGGRRHLSLIAFLLGLASVIFSLVLVVVSQLQVRAAADQEYLRTTRNEVRMLATAVDSGRKFGDDQLLNEVFDRWIQAGHWNLDPDEHFLIVNNIDSEVILDTLYRGPAHRPLQSKSLDDVVRAVREQMGIPHVTHRFLYFLYSDKFQSDSGEALIGSFMSVGPPDGAKGRNWLLGIYRSQAGLHSAAARFNSFGTLILICGLAMPLSLLLLYDTYRLARRDQIQAEEARARLAAIVQNSEDAIYSETPDGIINSWNRGAQRVFGYSEFEAVGRQSAQLIPAERSVEERQIIAQIAEGDESGERSLETIRVRKDGRSIHVSQAISVVRDARGRYVGVSTIARDITARKNLEREVLEITSQEQQRIGRELHDSLGQELTGLSYLAKSLTQKLTANTPQGETAQSIATGIQRALREVRGAVHGLMPVEVDASGFLVALEKLTADTQARCGTECRLESPKPVPIEDNLLATHLFRIVQEAINNAVKHARARQIVVRPESQNGTLTVTIQDDGVGIMQHADRDGGMGLRIMQYRAGVIDATLDVRTVDTGGTAVVCSVKNRGH